MGRLGRLHDQNPVGTKDLRSRLTKSSNIEVITEYIISMLIMSKGKRD